MREYIHVLCQTKAQKEKNINSTQLSDRCTLAHFIRATNIKTLLFRNQMGKDHYSLSILISTLQFFQNLCISKTDRPK